MRAMVAVAASGLAGIGAIVASLDSHADFVPFFAGLGFAAAVAGAVAHEPLVGSRRVVATAATVIWVIAAVWVGVLLVMANTVWQASGPTPTAEQAFLGIPATVYYVTALYGGTLLMILYRTLPASRPAGPLPSSPDHGDADRVVRDPA